MTREKLIEIAKNGLVALAELKVSDLEESNKNLREQRDGNKNTLQDMETVLRVREELVYIFSAYREISGDETIEGALGAFKGINPRLDTASKERLMLISSRYQEIMGAKEYTK